MAEPHALDPDGVVEAVVEGINTARRDSGMHVNGIGILSRTYGPEVAWIELNALLSQADQLVALDLAGDEANFPGGLFTEHVAKARDFGLQVTAHAGEAAGPESIWQAIQELGAARIGHAVHATADLHLMDYMRDNRIGVEANLTSNVQTSTVRDYASHPLSQFLDHGILATINTDDPGISGISLAYEYETAAPAAGLSQEQIRRAQQNALEVAFLQPEEKEQLLARAAEE
jgi:adenosine deaminase